MTATSLTTDRPDGSITAGSTYKVGVCNHQNWLLPVLSVINYQPWESWGILGFNTTFTGTAPEYSQVTFTSTDGQNAIRVSFTWSAGAIATLAIEYKAADPDTYSPLGSLSNAPASKDFVPNAPIFDYARPDGLNTPSSDTAGDYVADDYAIRENQLALACGALYKGPREDLYLGIPNCTPAFTYDVDGNMTQVDLNFSTSNVGFRYTFSYYEQNLFGDGDGFRLRAVALLISRDKTSQPYYGYSLMFYRRKGNGEISAVVPVGLIGEIL